MIHEEAAKVVHPGAIEFEPVRNILRVVIGWTFEIPREEAASVDYGWVTSDGQASGDKLTARFRAEKSLRAYSRTALRRHESYDTLGKNA